MRPEIYLAQVSAHAKLSCFDCHFSNAKIPGQGLIKLVPMIKAKIKDTYYLPITSNTPVSSKVCDSCHNMSGREATPSLDLIIPHDKHQSGKIPCLTCHTGLVHNQIAKRELTIEGDWEKWTPRYAQKVQKKIHYSVSMDDCMNCHKQNKATQSCAACHREIRRPQDHLQGSWDIMHGRMAVENVQYCKECHSNGIPLEMRTTPFVVKDYVQVNKFCSGCHQKKPKGHNQTWRLRHGPESRVRRCDTCHLPKTSTQKMTVVSCIECHKDSHEIPGETHPVKIVKPVDLNNCKTCHVINNCKKCH